MTKKEKVKKLIGKMTEKEKEAVVTIISDMALQEYCRNHTKEEIDKFLNRG